MPKLWSKMLASSSSTGATIGVAPSVTAAVEVKDEDSVWDNSGDLIVGEFGDGTLMVANGGSVYNANAYLGKTDIGTGGGSGTVAIVGEAAMWEIDGSLTVGADGEGELTIKEGGIVASRDSVIAEGSVGMRVSSAVEVDGTASQWTTNVLTIAVHGNGDLQITGGGLVSSTEGHVGMGVGVGAVTVVGQESRWLNSDVLVVGEVGDGTLSISSGGFVSNSDGTVGKDSAGRVNVDGAESIWRNDGDVTIGDSGNGTLTITDNGLAESVNGYVARASSSIGAVGVDGSGSTWSMSGDLIVVEEGSATLDITGGASVVNADGYIDNEGAGFADVTVSGSKSSWTNNGDLYFAAENHCIHHRQVFADH